MDSNSNEISRDGKAGNIKETEQQIKDKHRRGEVAWCFARERNWFVLEKECKDCKNYNDGKGWAVCDTCDPPFIDRWEQKMKARIKLNGNPLPQKNGEWWDLCTAEHVLVKSGEMRIIHLGVSVKPPAGYHFLVASRSSTPLKYGLIVANGIGIIEDNYCGDDDRLGLVVYATKAISIPKGTRIAQCTIVPKAPEFEWEVVDSMNEINRGGYGSTGEN